MSQKTCFVTIGATASFGALIEAAVSPSFLKVLEAQGYTDLLVQYGEDGKELYEKALQQAKDTGKVKVSGFDLDKGGLGRYMRQAKAVGASNKDSNEGVVISHAGRSLQLIDLSRSATDDLRQVPEPFSTPSGSASLSSSSRTPTCWTTTKSSWPRRCRSRSTSCTAS